MSCWTIRLTLILGLDELADAYRRVQRAIELGMEDAIEFTDAAKFDILDRDRNIVDAAFFVLIFGQLERRVTELAERKVPDHQKKTLREHKFQKRLEIALRDREDLKDEVESWYLLRNDPAHGAGIASGYEIGPVLARARELDRLLTAN